LFVTLVWLLNSQWNIAYAKTEQDLSAVPNTAQAGKIGQLLHKMESAYAKRDIEDYMSVFHDKFEYQSDNGTPEDESDDISGITRELEQESAVHVFEQFYTMEIDLLSGLKIEVTGDRAVAKSEYTIVGETFDPENWTLYMRGTNTFSLVKQKGHERLSEQWKIIRWQDNALSTKEIEDTKIINRTFNDLINALGGELKVWAPAMLILEEQIDSDSVTDNLFTIVKQGKNPKICARAARLLARSKLNEAKILALARLCENSRTDVALRIAILSALSAQSDQTAAEMMKKAALDGHPEVRAFATLQLSKLKSADVKKYLMDALNDSAANVRRAAAEAILIYNFLPYDNLSDPLIQLIQNPNEELPTRKVALRAFVKHTGSTVRSTIIKILTDNSFPDDLRAEATHILEKKAYNEPKVIEDQLLTIFQNPNESEILRAAAISALSRYATAKSTIPLIKALSSSSKRFKTRACSTLGLIQEKSAIEPILKLAMDKKEHIHVRRSAVEALWMLEANDTIPSLVQLLKDKSESGNFRGAIITVFGEWQVRRTPKSPSDSFGDERALNALLNVINSESEPWWLRRAAVRSLKNSREPRIMTVLNKLLNNNDERLKQAAMDKLKTANSEL
jgi:HEAT repeat protein